MTGMVFITLVSSVLARGAHSFQPAPDTERWVRWIRTRAVHLAQHVLAAAGEQLMLGIQVREVHQKRGLGLDLGVLLRRRLEITDHGTAARDFIFGFASRPLQMPGLPAGQGSLGSKRSLDPQCWGSRPH